MNIWAGIALITVGIAVDAFYKHRERKMEADAYLRGYKHAKAEFDIFNQGVSEGRAQEMLHSIRTQPSRKVEVPEVLLDQARKDGHATMRLQ